VIVGPDVHTQQEAFERLVAAGVCVQVDSAAALCRALTEAIGPRGSEMSLAYDRLAREMAAAGEAFYDALP
jgi:ribosomal protein S12 methylthiotransferase accessory factor YcaO